MGYDLVAFVLSIPTAADADGSVAATPSLGPATELPGRAFELNPWLRPNFEEAVPRTGNAARVTFNTCG
jgi:hypothetical protein